MISTFIFTGAFFLFIVLTGLGLRRMGSPYSIPLVTLHKLIGLGAGIYLGFAVYRTYQAAGFDLAQVVALALTVLLFAVNVATGSLLSTNKVMPKPVQTLNRWVPYLTMIATGWLIYQLS